MQIANLKAMLKLTICRNSPEIMGAFGTVQAAAQDGKKETQNQDNAQSKQSDIETPLPKESPGFNVLHSRLPPSPLKALQCCARVSTSALDEMTQSRGNVWGAQWHFLLRWHDGTARIGFKGGHRSAVRFRGRRQTRTKREQQKE
jgi:hypothetical protein